MSMERSLPETSLAAEIKNAGKTNKVLATSLSCFNKMPRGFYKVSTQQARVPAPHWPI
jgi:hypothetical protein